MRVTRARTFVTAVTIGVLIGVMQGTPASAAPSFDGISTGAYLTCGLTPTGGVKCWGNNEFGQLGDGNGGPLSAHQTAPVDVVGLASGVDSIASEYHTCAVTDAGAVKCWGRGTSGELGDGVSSIRLTPVDVAGLPGGIVAVDTSLSGFTCALTSTGGVKCWGNDQFGQMGDGGMSAANRYTPVDVSGLSSGAVAISTGSDNSCALTTAGGVKCWGYNVNGALGDGTNTFRYSSVNVAGLSSGVSAVSAGGDFACALTTAGGVKCWGSNTSGQLGDGSMSSSNAPVDVVGLSGGVTSISTGVDGACVIVTSGGVKCWGANNFGQLGNGSTSQSSTPVDVVGLSSGATSISAGDGHVCALTTGGSAMCWGENDEGQLGDGTTIDRHSPVTVGEVALTPTVTSLKAKKKVKQGRVVKLTATVASSPRAAGVVDFLIDGVLVGAGNLNAKGKAALSVTVTQSVGMHTVVSEYQGEASFAPSASAPRSLRVKP